jgi:polar amino acid transport system permease protein
VIRGCAFVVGSIDFDGHFFWDYLTRPSGFFLKGVAATVYLAVAGQVLGVVLGLPLALARRARNRLVAGAAFLYSWVWRGTPLLVQLLIIYTGLSAAGFYRWNDVHLGPVSIPGRVQAAIVTLGLGEAAYMGEIFRAAIGSIDRSQWEAARSLGMRPVLTMRLVILPQAARVVVPPLGNEFLSMLKTTSLLSIIGVTELFTTAQEINSATFRTFEIFMVAALWYLLLTSIWSIIQHWIEVRLSRSERQQVATAHGGPVSVAESKTMLERLTGIRQERI